MTAPTRDDILGALEEVLGTLRKVWTQPAPPAAPATSCKEVPMDRQKSPTSAASSTEVAHPAALDPQAWRDKVSDWFRDVVLKGKETSLVLPCLGELADQAVAALTAERARAEAAECKMSILDVQIHAADSKIVEQRNLLEARKLLVRGAEIERARLLEQLAAVTKERDEARRRADAESIIVGNARKARDKAVEELAAARRERHAHAASVLREVFVAHPRDIMQRSVADELAKMIEREEQAARAAGEGAAQ